MTADPYVELADLAERQVVLAGEDRWDELAELQAATAALTASLPATPPPAAAEALARAEEACVRVGAMVADALAVAEAELAHVQRGRAGIRAYVPGGLAPTVDRVG